MRIVQILTLLGVVLGAHGYLFHRLWFMIPSSPGRIVMLVAGITVVLFPILSLSVGNYLPQSLAAFMSRIGMSWIIVFLYLLLAVVLIDLVRVTHLLPIEKFFSGSWIGFLSLITVIAFCLGLGYLHYADKQRIELSLGIPKEGGRINTLKIVAISDLHLGYGIGREEFERWLPLINDEEADVVLIVGDLVDSNTYPLFARNFAESVRKIRAKQGVYAVLGNHEYIGNATKSALFLQSAGITLLRDSVILINDSFYLIGRDDRSNPGRKSIAELIAPTDKTKPLIMLDHQPLNLNDTEKNRIDLQLSGHTHNGQIWPFTWVIAKLFEHPYGYLKKGDSHIYVTSGLGIWGGKFRIGSQSEYVVIHLNFDGGR
ncbi:MAG: metallophosphoesterase [Tannerellaceae bacterium]|jgi:predicted MPP superfamily phosphohydrolase|nr:metallophosphoesterase [Tannerellaceae bacterium]